MSITTIVGDNIRGFRKRLRYSQEELAEHANIHRTYVGNVERGEKNLTIINIGKIAKALKIEPYLLFIKDSHEEK